MATFFLGRWHANKADGTLPQSSLSPPHTHLSLLPLPSISQLPSLASPPLSPYRKPEMLCTARRMGHTPSPLGCRAQRGQGGKWLCPNRWRQLAAKSCFYRYVCTHPHAYICTHTHIWNICIYSYICTFYTIVNAAVAFCHILPSVSPLSPLLLHVELSCVALRLVTLRLLALLHYVHKYFARVSPMPAPVSVPTPDPKHMPDAPSFSARTCLFLYPLPNGEEGYYNFMPTKNVCNREKEACQTQQRIYIFLIKINCRVGMPLTFLFV